MPDRSDRVLEAHEAAEEGELPYISKSRVKSWLTNPQHFKFKYVDGLKPKETVPMVRGTEIHEVFEDYYHAVTDYVAENGDLPDTHTQVELIPNWQHLGKYVVPYTSNFITFENRRMEAADTPGEYLPISIEEEHWVDPLIGMEKEPCWMGLADVIVPAASLPEVDSDSGVVIIDFKTGSVPDEKYRTDEGGIYTELEYYVMLFEDKYDVVGAAAYYPRSNELLVQPDDLDSRQQVLQAGKDMVEAVASDRDHFERNESPLCKWGEGPDEESEFYGLCNCTWGVPANNKERFTKLVEKGLHDSAVADKLGTTTDAVRYWRYKFDL